MRLIDADALANDLLYDVEMDAIALDITDFVGIERERIQFDKDCKQNCVYYLTETEPIDAVKVIRCKDCKYSYAMITAKSKDGQERWIRFCDKHKNWYPKDDWFCKDGEGKEK